MKKKTILLLIIIVLFIAGLADIKYKGLLFRLLPDSIQKSLIEFKQVSGLNMERSMSMPIRLITNVPAYMGVDSIEDLKVDK